MSTDPTEDALAALGSAVGGADVVPHPASLPDGGAAEPPVPDAAPEDAAGAAGEPESGGPVKRRDDDGLPVGCPVHPLGREGNTHFYLDALDQLVAMGPRDHGNTGILSLFGTKADLLEKWWPRKKLVSERDDDGNKIEKYITTGIKVEACIKDLMMATSRRGVWRPQGRLRGIGAWAEDTGELIFHCGNKLWTHAGEEPTGWRGGKVYPTYAPIPAPWRDPVEGGGDGPGAELFALLKTWNWARATLDVDALLFLGWIGAAFVGGALDWRPMVFVTGDKASGKSTLHKLAKYLFGDELIETADTTSAALSQELGASSVPVAIDELEADADNRRQRDVIKLARIAASGGKKRRGGADHKASEFLAQSCFLFSAILMPPLDPQDRSRMAILRLEPLPRTQSPPVIGAAHFRTIGAKLKRRMADQWHRFPETLEAYHLMLGRAGHDNRAADQFAPLMACADLLLHEDIPDTDTLDQWAVELDVSHWMEAIDTTSNAEDCLAWLAQTQPEAWRGGSKKSVAQLVEQLGDGAAVDLHAGARETLAAAGLGYVRSRDRAAYLAVPYQHKQVAALFAGTVWAGHAGAAGGWIEALTRLTGTRSDMTTRIGGRCTKCIHIPAGQVANDAPAEAAAEGGEVVE